EVVVFRQLDKKDFASIASLMLDEMIEPLAEKNLSISYDSKALSLIAEKSYGKPYGARDIRRVIRQEVEDRISEIIIENVSGIKGIDVSADGENITVTERKKGASENEV
ncbi:MAG: ATP-dependent Clp protease ATP-binding subunit, partial [Ruminococcus sp.]|nr:ATP-dependent Clp protease ATP-binding subunit [Ruminococcus sp.]